jgi:hypothetical protein
LTLNGRSEADVREWLGTEMQMLNFSAARGVRAMARRALAEPLCELAAWCATGFCALGSMMHGRLRATCQRRKCAAGPVISI